MNIETFINEKNMIDVDALKELDSLNIKKQNDMLESIINYADTINEKNKKEIAEYKILDSKRKIEIKKEEMKDNKVKAESKNKVYVNNSIVEYKDYIKKILHLSLEDLKVYLEDLNSNNELSKEFIIYLMLGVSSEINTYKLMLEDAFNNKDLELIKDINEEIIKLNNMNNLLKNYKNIDSVIKKEEYNKVLFFETSSKRAYFIEDIEGDFEFYNSYFNLLNSIIVGNPLKMKRFNNNDTLIGLTEARDIDGNTRIIFDKIDNNTYLIIHAFIKKSDNDKLYKERIVNRYKLYLEQKSKILSNIDNEEFLERQHSFVEQLENMFDKDIKQLKK